MSADQIRALADSGTPGPWSTDLYCSGTAIRDDQTGDVAVPIIKDADAAKIVAAVNALPKVADLIEATEDHIASWAYTGAGWVQVCSACKRSFPCRVAHARDALTAALGVTE